MEFLELFFSCTAAVRSDSLPISQVAAGGLRASPAIGRKLAEAEAELEPLESVRQGSTVVRYSRPFEEG
ncbi:MAG: hypothetical protein WB440_07805 [Steroidobacteraceae bacterium]|jgi:hypothetical protein